MSISFLPGIYEPPASWRDKMEKTDLQADARSAGAGATDPVTGASVNVTYPQPISEDIDLLDRKPCQGGICETYLIKEHNNNCSAPLKTVPVNATPVVVAPMAPPPNNFFRPCCNQLPPPQPCLAVACPPPAPMPACNPNCKPRPSGMWPSALYRRGGVTFEDHNEKT